MLSRSTAMPFNSMKTFIQKIRKAIGSIEKRRRFIAATIVLSGVLMGSTFISFSDIIFVLPILLVLVYTATYFSILEGITGVEWLLLFLVPVYFTTAFYSFYYFLPQRWLTRLPFGILYGISLYAILLSQNIFNVGVEKSIQLARAAFSVNYLFLTIALYLATSIIASLRLGFLFNALFFGLLTFPVALHFLWSVNPSEHIEKLHYKFAFFISLLVAEVGLFFSFIPVNPSIFALVGMTVFYCLCGIFQAYVNERLFRDRIREYIFVFGFILILVFLSLRW